MKMNKKNATIFFILLILTFYAQYDFFKSNDYTLPPKTISDLDSKVFKAYSQKSLESIDANPFWGFSKEKKTIINDMNETNTSNKQIAVTQEAGKNVLCVASSCYRLLGIYYKNANASITLYNKNFKEKIKTYNEKNMLQDGIMVDKISSFKVDLKDTHGNRRWHFEIFDVNQTKYKPKEIKE